MSVSKLLHELQEIDLEIEQKTGTLAQITAQIGKDDDVVAARSALEAARKRLLDLEHQQRDAEWSVGELEQKIAAEEKKLYDGSVKNPRELMSLQQEIESIKNKCGEREEHLLAVMMDVDAARQDSTQQSEGLQSLETQWREDQERFLREQKEMGAVLADLAQKRGAFAAQIDADSLSTYGELRRVKQGLAVARLVQGRCEGCRISLPVSDLQKARAGRNLATCSNCGRVLYMD